MFKFLYCSEKQGFGKGSNEGEGDGLFSVPYATPLPQFPFCEPVKKHPPLRQHGKVLHVTQGQTLVGNLVPQKVFLKFY